MPFLVRFFELDYTMDPAGHITGFGYSDLRKHETYVVAYTLWFRLVTTAIIPFLVMLCCNLGIIIYYRRNRYAILVQGLSN